jgi:uncharacterized protein (TIGR02246 family)
MSQKIDNASSVIMWDVIQNWLKVVKTHKPKDIANLYAKDAVLLGTVALNVTQGREVIETYFDGFVLKEPSGTINSIIFQTIGDKFGVADGTYTFNLKNEVDKEPKRIYVNARFTFLIDLESKEIKTHHSSSTPKNKITEI